VRKIDWHDYKKIAEEAQRHGPGEQGVGFVLDAREEKQKNNFFRENGFNAYVSDKISLERSINDIRHSECKKKLYLEKLPNVSIIIPFHNEHLSVLLRSVYSIINRTPKELLEEIILVDDFSTKSFLKDNLDNYVKTNFAPNLIKIIRLTRREGLIRTRLAGARQARGEVLIFFDSHIECNINWLPPLIEPIAYNYKTSVCPFIDVINDETFAYSAQDNGARGAFDWDLFYKRLPLLDTSKPTEPFDDPVMAGGLFAISTKWFWELEGYDEGLEIWGGEQYELSFKIWQCGGRLVDAPCSRVGHIYRKFNPFGSAGHGDYLSKNHKRVAEVWMDEYKKYYYKENSYLK
jgi:polypeptide N-acetylgalactosaminyltransferase